ncbi:MAG: hypothetical protein HC907_37815, partial [Richelia sp. SM1_7_0]|nr:hypothetical protein [Richelia sp. SM1_7_0]
DFAFAIWDERRQTLFCARDHFGGEAFFIITLLIILSFLVVRLRQFFACQKCRVRLMKLGLGII